MGLLSGSGQPSLRGDGPLRPATIVAMTSIQSLPTVQDCSATSCAYNEGSSCHAGAITVAGDNAQCGTFVEISFRGGVDGNGVVGACHRSECKFNDKLECTASSVQIGQSKDVADCLTYEAR
jgi:hypothetical protein